MKIFTKGALALLAGMAFGSMFMTGCGGVSVENAEVNDLKWLEGQWSGKSQEKAIQSRFTQLSENNITGSSYILSGEDTTDIRAMDISTTNGKIILSLRTKTNRSEVGYELKKIGDKKAVFQNEEAQFPRTIGFALQKDTLKNKWKGESRGQEFKLVKSREISSQTN